MKGKELELELTYLAAVIPAAIKNVKPTRLVDIYFPEELDIHPKLRIRQKGDKYELTKKVPLVDGDMSRQHEYNAPLTEVEFNALASASGRKATKDRYKVKLAGRTAEIDLYQDELEGLVIIDFEFETDEEKDSFKPPAECLADVTQEGFIAGGRLAGLAYDDIEQDLKRFNYKKLV